LHIAGSAAAGAQWYRDAEFENLIPVTERTKSAAVIEAEQSIKLVILPSVAGRESHIRLGLCFGELDSRRFLLFFKTSCLRSARFTKAARFKVSGSIGRWQRLLP
jgi:hypothetical protein